MPPRLNADWHRANPMPARPTLDQRVAWHLEHAKACACREMPASIAVEVARRAATATSAPAPPARSRRPR